MITKQHVSDAILILGIDFMVYLEPHRAHEDKILSLAYFNKCVSLQLDN